MTLRIATALAFALPLFAIEELPLIEGNPKGLVRVVIYEDLQCSDCAAYRKMMDEQLLPKFASQVAFEHRDFPLPKHKWARQAAIAARFFATLKPDTAVAFRRETLAHLSTITPENFNAHLTEFAKAHDVDPARAIAALDEAWFAKLVEDDYQEGIARGISKTPTVFVDSEPFVESFSAEDISKTIQAALEVSKRR
ncbi:MAG: thioredoxin domain-containing protein [Bryobacteraceae bacterium]